MRWLWLIFISVSVNAQDTLTYEYEPEPWIIIDHSLCQPVYPYDAGPSGISYFYNHVIYPGYRPGFFENGDFEDADFLKNAIILVPPAIHRKFKTFTIKEPTDSIFKDIAQLEYWAKRGANVVFIAEHDNYYCNANNINAITDKYGIHVNNNAVLTNNQKKTNNLQEAWPIGKSAWFGIDSIRFYLPASLTCDNTVNVWATIDTSIICANVPVDEGSITVIADYEMFWNMTTGHGIHYGNNIPFLQACFNSLLEPATNIDNLYSPSHFLAMLMDTVSGYIPVSYADINPLDIKPNHLVVFDRPTDQINWPDSVFKKIKKALIIGGPHSNYFGMLEKNNGSNVLQTLGYVYDTLPINKIAAHFGLRFSESIICDGELNHNWIDLQGGSTSHRICEKSGYIYTGTSKIEKLFTEQKALGKVLYTAGKNSVETDYNAPLQYDETLGCDTIITVKNAPSADGAIIAYYNKDVFAISGPEMLYQLFSADRQYSTLWKAFNDWLQLK